jgi:hypothetical protein
MPGAGATRPAPRSRKDPLKLCVGISSLCFRGDAARDPPTRSLMAKHGMLAYRAALDDEEGGT